ncbi:MAG: gluconokinase [Chthoniobacteraceae bacterium]
MLAIDLGTSSTRTALFDLRGRRLLESTAQHGYPLLTTPEGGAELDPRVLEKTLHRCLRETLKHADGARITAVGGSCFWHSMIGVNERNEPLTPVYTWADSRCREDAARLREKFSEKKVHARTGCMLRASFWPARLAWWKRTQPKQKIARWISPVEWLYGGLVGRGTTSLAMASGTGLFQPGPLTWDGEMLEAAGIKTSQLNEVSDAPVPGAPSPFPALREAQWFPAIGDGAASNLGSGAIHDGLAALNVGTSAALRVVRRSGPVRAPFGLFCYRVDAERFLVGGAVSNAGNLRAWGLRELRLDSATLERQLAARPLPQHGLTVLPFWSAERAPTWNEEQPGVILGLNHGTTAVDLLQAITEASYYRMARIASLLRASQKESPQIIVSGGIQRSRVALQRLANVLDAPLYASEEPEASIRGAAVFALEKLGLTPAPLRFKKPLQPDPVAAKGYAAEIERQARLEERL